MNKRYRRVFLTGLLVTWLAGAGLWWLHLNQTANPILGTWEDRSTVGEVSSLQFDRDGSFRGWGLYGPSKGTWRQGEVMWTGERMILERDIYKPSTIFVTGPEIEVDSVLKQMRARGHLTWVRAYHLDFGDAESELYLPDDAAWLSDYERFGATFRRPLPWPKRLLAAIRRWGTG